MAWENWSKRNIPKGNNNDEPAFEPIDAKGVLDNEYHSYIGAKAHNGLIRIPKNQLYNFAGMLGAAARSDSHVMTELYDDLPEDSNLWDAMGGKLGRAGAEVAMQDVNNTQIRPTVNSPLYDASRAVEGVAKALPKEWESNVDESSLPYWQQIAGGVVENAPSLAANAAMYAMNPAVGTAFMLGDIAGGTTADLSQKGVDIGDAWQAGALNAAAQEPLELVGASTIANIFKGVTPSAVAKIGSMPILKSLKGKSANSIRNAIGAAFVNEGIPEMAQEIPDEVISYIAEHGSMEGFDYGELASNMVDAGLVGGVTGGILATPGAIANRFRTPKDPNVVHADADIENGESQTPSDDNGVGTIDNEPTDTVGSLLNAIGGQETGGEADQYGAYNADGDAHGKYQITSDTWAANAEAAGVDPSEGMTPENQEKVARYMMNQYVQKYGEDGAIIAWYAGEGTAQAYVDGTLSEEAFTRKQGDNGEYPSIKEYLESVQARRGQGGATQTTRGTSQRTSEPQSKSAAEFLEDIESTMPLDTEEQQAENERVHKTITQGTKDEQDALAREYGWNPEPTQNATIGEEDNGQGNVQPVHTNADRPQNNVPQAKANPIETKGTDASQNGKPANIKPVYTPGRNTAANGNGNNATYTGKQNNAPVVEQRNSFPQNSMGIYNRYPQEPSKPLYEQRETNGIADRQQKDRWKNTNRTDSRQAQRISKALSNSKFKGLVKQAFVDGDASAQNRINAMNINPEVLEAVKGAVIPNYVPQGITSDPNFIPASGQAQGANAPTTPTTGGTTTATPTGNVTNTAPQSAEGTATTPNTPEKRNGNKEPSQTSNSNTEEQTNESTNPEKIRKLLPETDNNKDGNTTSKEGSEPESEGSTPTETENTINKPGDNGEDAAYNGENGSDNGGQSHGEEQHDGRGQEDIQGASGGVQGRSGDAENNRSNGEGQRAENEGTSRNTKRLLTEEQKESYESIDPTIPADEWQDKSEDLDEFSKALDKAKADNEHGAFVDEQSPEELTEHGAKVAMTSDGLAGVAVENDGNIVAVFKNPIKAVKKAVDSIITMARAMGGTKMDCYGKGLLRKYERLGYKVVARVPFTDAYIDKDDNGKAIDPKKQILLDERPDVYVLMTNGDDFDTATKKIKNDEYAISTQEELDALPVFNGMKGYERAKAYRDAMLAGNQKKAAKILAEQKEADKANKAATETYNDARKKIDEVIEGYRKGKGNKQVAGKAISAIVKEAKESIKKADPHQLADKNLKEEFEDFIKDKRAELKDAQRGKSPKKEPPKEEPPKEETVQDWAGKTAGIPKPTLEEQKAADERLKKLAVDTNKKADAILEQMKKGEMDSLDALNKINGLVDELEEAFYKDRKNFAASKRVWNAARRKAMHHAGQNVRNEILEAAKRDHPEEFKGAANATAPHTLGGDLDGTENGTGNSTGNTDGSGSKVAGNANETATDNGAQNEPPTGDNTNWITPQGDMRGNGDPIPHSEAANYFKEIEDFENKHGTVDVIAAMEHSGKITKDEAEKLLWEAWQITDDLTRNMTEDFIGSRQDQAIDKFRSSINKYFADKYPHKPHYGPIAQDEREWHGFYTRRRANIESAMERFRKGELTAEQALESIETIVKTARDNWQFLFGKRHEQIQRGRAAGKTSLDQAREGTIAGADAAYSWQDSFKSIAQNEIEELEKAIEENSNTPSVNPIIEETRKKLRDLLNSTDLLNVRDVNYFYEKCEGFRQGILARTKDKAEQRALANLVRAYQYKAFRTYCLMNNVGAGHDRVADIEGLKATVKFTKEQKLQNGLAKKQLGEDLYNKYYLPVAVYLASFNPEAKKAATDSAYIMAKMAQSIHENYGIWIPLPVLATVVTRVRKAGYVIEGQYTPSTHVIGLSKKYTMGITFLHEVTHMYEDTLKTLTELSDEEIQEYFDGNMDKANKAMESIRKDLASIEDWASYSEKHLAEYEGTKLEREFKGHAKEVINGNDIGEETWRSERLARGAEKYFLTGEAPTNALKRIFERLKSFLQSYINDRNLMNGELPPEVKAFYDKMVAGDPNFFKDKIKEDSRKYKKDKARTDDGKEFEITYKIVPGNTLISSSNYDFVKNDKYPSELQPRNRDRAAMKAQVDDMAHNLNPADLAEARSVNQGAPVINQDNVVENGNGRTMAITRAYKMYEEVGEKYRQSLIENAEKYGYTREEVETMENPILVRQRSNDSDNIQDSIIHSTVGGMRMSAAQQAQADAKRLSDRALSKFKYDEDSNGDLTKKSYQDFVITAINDIADKTERDALLQEDGTPSAEGIRRVRAALAVMAYGDSTLIERAFESTDTDSKNTVNAFIAVAPQVAVIKNRLDEGTVGKEYDLPKILTEALDTYLKIKREGKPISFALDEIGLFGEGLADISNPQTRLLVRFLDANARSQKAIVQAITDMADSVIANNLNMDSMFGDTVEAVTMDDIIRRGVGLNESPFEAMKPGKDGQGKIKIRKLAWNTMTQEQIDKIADLAKANGGTLNKKTGTITFKDGKAQAKALNALDAYYASISNSDTMKFSERKVSSDNPTKKLRERISHFCSEEELSPREKAIVSFAKKMGLTVQFFDGDTNLHGFHADGSNTVFLNRKSAMDLNKVFWHESFHWMRENNPELYNRLVKEVFGDEISMEQLADYAASIGRTDMSVELCVEEMLADAMFDAGKRGNFFEKIGAEHPSLCAKLLKWISNLYKDFTSHFRNPEAGLTNTQVKRMAVSLSEIANRITDGNGNKLFAVDEKGNIKETAAGRKAISGEIKYKVTNKNLHADDRIEIVDLDDNIHIGESVSDRSKRIKEEWRGKKIVTTHDGIVVKMEGSENLSHLAGGRKKFLNNKTKVKALSTPSNLQRVIENSVYVEQEANFHDDKSHKAFAQLYSVVKNGGNYVRLKLTLIKGVDGTYTVDETTPYNLRPEGTVSKKAIKNRSTNATPPTKGGKLRASVTPTITVADLLDGVKDLNDNPYVVDGELQYDTKVVPGVKHLLEESQNTTSHTSEQMKAQVMSNFPNARNIVEHENGISFDLPNGLHVEANFTDDTIAIDWNKAQADYGGNLTGKEKALGRLETVDRDAIITLTKDSVEEAPSHEAMHLAMGLLNDNERTALFKKFGNEEAICEAMREWKIRRNEGKGTSMGKIMQKISDIAYKLLGLFKETDHNIFRKLESGELWEREVDNKAAAHVSYLINPANNIKDYLSQTGNAAYGKYEEKFKPEVHAAKQNPHIMKSEKGKESGWSAGQWLANNTLQSPSRIKSFAAKRVHDLADIANRKMNKLYGDWTNSFARAIQGMNEEEKTKFTDILWNEDANQKVYTDSELKDMGCSDNVIRAHKKTRNLLHKIYTAVNDVYTGTKVENHVYASLKGAQKAQKEFAKRPHIEVFHDIKEVNVGGKKQYQVSVRTVGYHKTSMNLTEDEIEKEIKQNKDRYLVKSEPILNEEGEQIKNAAGKPLFNVSFLEYNKPLTDMEGYVPHIFHGIMIIRSYTDENGNRHSEVVGSADNMDKAVVEADKLQQELGGEFLLAPKQFNSEGEVENPLFLGDKEYKALMDNLKDSMTLSLEEAREATQARTKGRHVNYSALKKRKGAKGFETNAIWAIQHHIGSSARYVALDPFKSKAINLFERVFGDFDDDWAGKNREAEWIKGYIDSMLGKPGVLEKVANSFLKLFPMFKNESRPAQHLASTLTGLTGVLKLGASPAAGFVNMLQILNCVGYVGARKTAVGIKRAMHLTSQDIRILKMAGADDEVGLAFDGIGKIPLEQEKYSKTLERINNLREKVMLPFTLAERTIRRATILSAYYDFIEKNKDRYQNPSDLKQKAIAHAIEINRKVNFDYSMADSPRIFRAVQGTVIGDIALQFQKYGVKELEVIGDFLPILGKETSTKQKIEFFVPYLLVAGLWNALPFEDAILALLGMLFGIDDPEKAAKKAMIEWAGTDPAKKAMVDVANYGAGSIVGMDISQRVGLKGITPDTSNILKGGPTGSTAVQLSQAILNGDVNTGMKAVSPAMGNIYGAAIGYNTDSKGRKTVDYDGWDRTMRALGFRTTREAHATDAQSIVYNYKETKKKDRAKAKEAYFKNPSGANYEKLLDLGYTRKEIKNLKNDKQTTRAERSETGLSKDDKKKLDAVLHMAN